MCPVVADIPARRLGPFIHTNERLICATYLVSPSRSRLCTLAHDEGNKPGMTSNDPYSDRRVHGDEQLSRKDRRAQESRHKRRSKRRGLLLGFGLFTLVVVALVGWLGYNAKTAYSNLNAAKDHAQAAKTALLAGDTATGKQHANTAVADADTAKSATDSLVWKVASSVPYLGSPLDVVAQITDVVDGLASDVLMPAAEVGAALNPSQLRGADGRIDVLALRNSAPSLQQASVAADSLSLRAAAIGEPSYLTQVTDARNELQNQTHELAMLLNNTSIAARVLPSMIGADGPRSYFMAFQTNAEARGTGGLIGGFGIVDAVDGKVEVNDLASNRELQSLYDPIDLGPDFYNLYEQNYQASQNWQNSNVSPHFPYAAQIWRSMWEQETGQMVDGAIATDPVALSYILGVTGPVTMADGEVIGEDNIVRITQSDAYFRFPDDQIARKDYLQDIASRVVVKMQGDIASPARLLEALGRATSEGHIAVWSADPALQDILGPTKIGHEIPDTPAPYAAIVVNNGAGGKLDYYLQRDITYTGGSCDTTTRDTKVVAEITNSAPAQDYPVYVAGRQNESTRYEGPPGTNRTVVALYATQGATLKSATLNGKSVLLLSGVERGHPTFYVPVVTAPGKTNVLEYNLVEPTAAGEAQAPIQPQVEAATSTVSVPTCR